MQFRIHTLLTIVLLFLSLGGVGMAAVVMKTEGDPNNPDEPSLESLVPELGAGDPSVFLPETFRLDIGPHQDANMNPLVRKLYNRLARKDIRGALLALEDMQETEFLNPKLYTTQAQLHIFLKQYDEARKAARQALRYDQSFMRAHKMLAFINMLDGQSDQAINDLLDAMQYDRNDTEVLKLAAFGYLNNKDYRGAAKIFAHITRIDSKSPGAFSDLGNAWLHLGEIDSALAALEQAVKLAPNSPSAYTDLGTALIAAGYPNKALSAFAGALRVNPHHSPAMANIGVLVYNDGQIQTGLQLLTRACYADPRSDLAWNNLLLVLVRVLPILPEHTVGRPNQGIYPLRIDRMYYAWGLHFATQQRTDAAVSHLVKALQENPGDPEFMNDLGGLLAGSKAYDLARVMFRRALHTLPGYVAAQNNLDMVERQIKEANHRAALAAAKPRTEQTVPVSNTPVVPQTAP